MMAATLDWNETIVELGKLLLAYFLALPVGWHREKEAHSVGVRTFPLVAVASCGYLLLTMPSGTHSLDAQSRVLQGMVTGIGFIGAGAILKSEANVHGTATAASIWITGVQGAAVAQERFTMAVVLAALNLLTLRVLLPLKQRLGDHADSSGSGDPV